MADTIKQLIQGCLPLISLPADPIQNDVRDLCLSVYNYEGREIHEKWPWDQTTLPEFEVTSDASGIITFPATTDVVRSLRPSAANGQFYDMEPLDPILAAAQGSSGDNLPLNKFIILNDSAGGFRRVQVKSPSTSFKANVLTRWVDATASNWDTLSFPIERAVGAVREYILDGLRAWAGEQVQGKGDKRLLTALTRETVQQRREIRVVPRHPSFGEVGNW